MMEDRRRNMRTEMMAELVIKRLDQPGEEKVNIQVCDISTGGLGFLCNEVLEKGSVFECILTLWNKDVIHSFVEIVRKEDRETGYRYGGSFVGMTDQDAYRIQVFQTVEKYLKEED